MPTPDEEVGQGFLKRIIGGQHSASMASARAGVKVDVTELKKVRGEFDVIRKSVTDLRKEMDLLAKSAGTAMSQVRSVRGGTATAQNGMPMGVNSSLTQAPGRSSAPVSGAMPGLPLSQGGKGSAMGGMRGAFANFGGTGLAAMVLGQIGGQVMGAIDRRADEGMSYASNADRMNVILQQQTGLSQMQVMNQLRRPLQGARLGQGGINDMMQYGIKTGQSITPQFAQSVAGIRALSGYTKSTQDVLTDQKALLDPHTANRMFNTLGVNAYGYGGKVNDPLQMRQAVVRQMGLANSSILKSAQMPGSITRARMADAGVPEEMQDEILSYAKDQVTFQKKGGKGSYDPSKKADRKRMGIEENFATQQEETARLRNSRDENFTRRQLDNMASLERNTQTMVKLLGSIEDKLSGALGARISNRGWMSKLGSVGKIVGAAVTPFAPEVGIPMMAASALMSGDPVDAAGGGGQGGGTGHGQSGNDSNIMVPSGYGGKRQSLSNVKQMATFKGLNPKMQDRLLNMMRANPNIGIGQGKRSSADQESMFRSRYKPTSNKTPIFWQGQYWEHVSGAAAAPPGRSMHEIGLAADLVGDLGWMNANAEKFGLKHFANVNGEPWHVQPAELPSGRTDYEKGGATWGTDGGGPETNKFAGKVPTTTGDTKSGGETHAMPGGTAGGRGWGHISFGGGSKIVTGSAPSNKTDQGIPTGGAMTAVQIAKLAYGAGFKGDDLVKMIAISKRESHWNPRAYNGNEATGDHSYGLWQLNTLNSKKGGMMGDLVNSILGLPKGNTNFDALFDPQTNAMVAHKFYERNGNTTRPWGGYKGVSDTHGGADSYLAEASAAVKAAGISGDPMPGGGGHGAPMSISHAPTYQITVAPQISFIGTPGTPDLKNIAKQVGAMLHQEVRNLEMRNA